MILSENDLEVNFTDAIDAHKFDDNLHSLSHCMKAVDFVVELSEAYLFVEVKDPAISTAMPANQEAFKMKATNGKLRDELIKKFRDSFIYRWAENKMEKPIHFLMLVTLEEALLKNLQDDLHRHLPFNGPVRWSRKIAESCHILNIEAWNRNFPKWPLTRLSAASTTVTPQLQHLEGSAQ